LRTIAVLGATGSIGRQALDLIRRYPDQFKASVLTANQNHEALFDMVRAFRPEAAGLVVEPKELPEDVRFCDWYFGEDCSEARAAASPSGRRAGGGRGHRGPWRGSDGA